MGCLLSPFTILVPEGAVRGCDGLPWVSSEIPLLCEVSSLDLSTNEEKKNSVYFSIVQELI